MFIITTNQKRRWDKLRRRHKRNGFTLIEIIVVIILIGIMSAVIVPGFVDFSRDAQLAKVTSIASAYETSVKLVNNTFKIKGYKTRVQDLPDFGDGTVDTNNIGFPIGIDKGTGNENIGRGNNGCVGLMNALLESPPTVASNNDNQDFRSYRHTGNRICSYVYRGNGDTGNRNTGLLVIRYDSRDGTVDVCGTREDIPDC